MVEVFLIVITVMGQQVAPIPESPSQPAVFATRPACLKHVPIVQRAIGRWSISVTKIECQKREVAK